MQPTTDPVVAPPHAIEALQVILRDLDQIIQLADGSLRNLLITQRYHDLSRKLAAVLGPLDVNWSTFATWASKTAGASIRGEVVPRWVRLLLAQEGRLEQRWHALRPRWLLGDKPPIDSLFELSRGAIARVQHQVAEGNLRVFRELAPLFARFEATFCDLPGPDETVYEGFEREVAFRPGPPDRDDGQDLLKTAFRHYYECIFEADQTVRAQKMLFANCMIGLHEQTRLQINIQGALDAPIQELVEARALRKLPSLLPAFARKPAESLALALARPVVKVADNVWDRIATATLMSLVLPGGRAIALGQDVPEGKDGFPSALRELTYGPLVELVNRYDKGPNTTRGSGADDWTDLAQRMAFIIDLFRVNQRSQVLYEEPFSAPQRADIDARRVPSGNL